MNTLTKDTFRQALDQTFVLQAGANQTLELSLIAITDLNLHVPSAGTVRNEPFSLTFHGPATPWARQHTYRLENKVLGPLDIFLVPLGLTGNRMQYEAVFT